MYGMYKKATMIESNFGVRLAMAAQTAFLRSLGVETFQTGHRRLPDEVKAQAVADTLETGAISTPIIVMFVMPPSSAPSIESEHHPVGCVGWDERQPFHLFSSPAPMPFSLVPRGRSASISQRKPLAQKDSPGVPTVDLDMDQIPTVFVGCSALYNLDGSGPADQRPQPISGLISDFFLVVAPRLGDFGRVYIEQTHPMTADFDRVPVVDADFSHAGDDRRLPAVLFSLPPDLAKDRFGNAVGLNEAAGLRNGGNDRDGPGNTEQEFRTHTSHVKLSAS